MAIITSNHYRKQKAAMLFLQSLFELGEAAVSSDLQLLDRFLQLNGPLPFELVLAWLNLKSHLKQHELVKEKLETFMGMYAERVKRGGVATSEMCSQYAALAYVYTVQTLPHLGEIEGAQRFLAIHNNNILLSREKRQDLLHALNEEIASSETLQQSQKEVAAVNTSGASSIDQNNTTPRASRSGSEVGIHSPSSASTSTTPTGQSNSATRHRGQSTAKGSSGSNAASRSSRKQDDDGDDEPALILTKDQVLAIAGASAVAALVLSQRKRIFSTASKISESLGNFLFGGT